MSDNRKKIKAEYRKRATKSVTVQFYKNTEQPLIEHLEQQPNKSGYIKGLIKEDIEKNRNDFQNRKVVMLQVVQNSQKQRIIFGYFANRKKVPQVVLYS